MDRDKIRNLYFNWLNDQIYDKDRYEGRSYRKLILHLDDVIFTYKNRMDENRESDGIDMRYSRFGWEYQINSYTLDQCFDPDHCSLLEMLIALAIRCEENFMQDIDQGNRTAKWFWKMIDNMGLGDMDDISFKSSWVNEVIDRFMNNEYESDGRGGLFYIPDAPADLRNVEIWCQLCWFLDGYTEKV